MSRITVTSMPDDGDGQHGDMLAMIRPHHRTRWAIVYIRQSSEQQVRHHTGSTQAQRDLAASPRRLGWPESLIRVIDDDLGLSGKSSSKRTGFQELLALMHRDEVGLVVIRDVSRISRDPLDAERFLHAAIRADVLVEADGQLYDPTGADLSELFGLRIKALLAWWDNEQRARTLQQGKEAQMRKGFAVSRPPTGYIRSGKGTWAKHPDPDVQHVIRRTFELYLELRSIVKVAERLAEE